MHLFQFHKGTIRTSHQTKRLGPYFYFNSIKVQLEQPKTRNTTTEQVKFQFHKGTIRTR